MILTTPRIIDLPYGYKIRVKQLTDKLFNEEWGADCWAGWVVEEMTIYLRRSRHPYDKAADLAHELQHALVDYAEHVKALRDKI